MYNTSHKDFACLLNILDSISKINQYTKVYENADELYDDTKSFDAVMMNFVVIREMAEKLNDDFKISTEAQVDWIKIQGFRNIIAHNYFGIDAEEVWQIIKDKIPGLEKALKKIVNS